MGIRGGVPGAVLALGLVAAAAFIWLSSASLPDVVASHFDLSGRADGFSSRAAYRNFTVVLVVVIPLWISLSGRLVSVLPPGAVNLPNREYWLAPERREATGRSFGTWMTSLALFLLAFLCAVHGLVLAAHATAPPQLSRLPFYLALGVFLLGTTLWVVGLYRRFARVELSPG